MLKHVFQDEKWIITPEKFDQYSKKRPDFVVEEFFEGELRYHMAMVLKANDKSKRFEEALEQVVKEIAETFEFTIKCFVVIQCGRRIGFFEYHNDISNLDEEGIAHFDGCISLTQTYDIQESRSRILTDIPDDLLPLYHDEEKLQVQKDVRERAKKYKEKCVFDFERHEKETDFLFRHMPDNWPRSV